MIYRLNKAVNTADPLEMYFGHYFNHIDKRLKL